MANEQVFKNWNFLFIFVIMEKVYVKSLWSDMLYIYGQRVNIP